MQKLFISMFVILAGLLISCSGVDETACNESTIVYTTTNAGNVTYTATVTGDSTIRSLRYGGSAGEVFVDNPTLPFIQAGDVPAGTRIFISVTANARGGTVMAEHSFTDGAAEVNQDQISCFN